MTVTFFPFAFEKPLFGFTLFLGRVLFPPLESERERTAGGSLVRSAPPGTGTDSVHQDTASGSNPSSIFLLEKRSRLSRRCPESVPRSQTVSVPISVDPMLSFGSETSSSADVFLLRILETCCDVCDVCESGVPHRSHPPHQSHVSASPCSFFAFYPVCSGFQHDLDARAVRSQAV